MQRLLRPAPGPSTLKSTRWAGTRLAALRDHPDPHARIGESWEFSTLPGSESRVGDRPLAAALGRARPPAPPQLGHLFEPPLDPFLAAALPIKLP